VYVYKFYTDTITSFEYRNDASLRGPVQELDFDSDSDEEELIPVKSRSKKSKQAERPSKIIPALSDHSSDSDEDEDEDEEERITMANMAARSKALDEQALAEAKLDEEEMQRAVEEGDDGDEFDEDELDEDEDEEDGEQKFHLPTAEEREEEENAGGPDVHTVQRRIQEIARVLRKFKKLGEKGRYVIPFSLLGFPVEAYSCSI
jgi:25S rRNA (cytosine2870-C5)-methyltransferase